LNLVIQIFNHSQKASGKSENQGHYIHNLMDRLQYQGFLRKKRGLNQLETIQEFAKILKQPNDEFDFKCRCETIDTHLPNYWPHTATEAPKHWPVISIFIYNREEPEKPHAHALALQEYQKAKNPQNERGILKFKNSWGKDWEQKWGSDFKVKEDEDNQLITPWFHVYRPWSFEFWPSKPEYGKWKLRPGWDFQSFNLEPLNPGCWYVDFH